MNLPPNGTKGKRKFNDLSQAEKKARRIRDSTRRLTDEFKLPPTMYPKVDPNGLTIQEILGEAVRRLRKRTRPIITQEALAYAIGGKKVDAISTIESASVNFSVVKLLRILKACNVKPSVFFQWIEEELYLLHCDLLVDSKKLVHRNEKQREHAQRTRNKGRGK